MAGSPQATTAAGDQSKPKKPAAFFMDLEGGISYPVPKFKAIPKKMNDEIRQYAARLAEEKRTSADLRVQLKQAEDQRDDALLNDQSSTKSKRVWKKKYDFVSTQLLWEKKKTETDVVKELTAVIKELQEKLEDGVVPQCFLCCNRNVEVVFLCGHSSCRPCAENLTQCHVCRKDLRQFTTVYLQ